MTRKLPALLAAAALAAGGLSACGGSDEEEMGPATGAGATEAEQTETTGPSTAGQARQVAMVNIEYSPSELTVGAGETVTWVNEDPVAHTVTVEDGPDEFDSGQIDANGRYERKLDTPGEYQIICTLHPGQEMTLTVEE